MSSLLQIQQQDRIIRKNSDIASDPNKKIELEYAKRYRIVTVILLLFNKSNLKQDLNGLPYSLFLTNEWLAIHKDCPLNTTKSLIAFTLSV